MEIQVTQEQVEQIVETLVKSRIDALEERDDYGYRFSLDDYIRDTAEKLIKQRVEELLAEKEDEIAVSIVEDFLDRKVEVNNGWGERRKYETFADFFAAEVRKRLDDSWEIKRKVEKAVKERVDSEWSKAKEAAVQIIIASMQDGDKESHEQ